MRNKLSAGNRLRTSNGKLLFGNYVIQTYFFMHKYDDYYQIQGQNDCISGLIMTELNPNYEFAGGSCSIQDLMEVDRDNLMLVK